MQFYDYEDGEIQGELNLAKSFYSTIGTLSAKSAMDGCTHNTKADWKEFGWRSLKRLHRWWRQLHSLPFCRSTKNVPTTLACSGQEIWMDNVLLIIIIARKCIGIYWTMGEVVVGIIETKQNQNRQFSFGILLWRKEKRSMPCNHIFAKSGWRRWTSTSELWATRSSGNMVPRNWLYQEWSSSRYILHRADHGCVFASPVCLGEESERQKRHKET